MVLNSPLWKSVFIIGSGTAFAQIIGIISTPIITRLYAPSDFGILGVYSSILSILIVMASLRYEFAIPVPKNSSKAANLFVLCFIVIFGSVSVLSVSLLLMGNVIMEVLGTTVLKPFLWLIVIGFLGSGIYQVLNYWAIRQQDYSRITMTNISQSLGGSTCKIMLGLLSLGPLGLISGFIISNIAGIGTFIKEILRKDRGMFREVTVTEIKSVSREYKSFPLYSTPASLLYVFSLQIPVFALSIAYGLDVVGWYTLAYQMLALPISLVARSMSQAFYGEAAKAFREKPDSLKSLYLDTTKKLALIGIPLVSTIALLAPWVFPIVFGGAWGSAGILCLPLAFVAISDFIINPTNKLGVYGFNRLQLLFHIFRFVLIAIGFYIASSFGFNVVTSLTLYGCIVAFTYIVLFILNIKAIDSISQ